MLRFILVSLAGASTLTLAVGAGLFLGSDRSVGQGPVHLGAKPSPEELFHAFANPYPRCGFEPPIGGVNDKDRNLNIIDMNGRGESQWILGGRRPVLAYDGGGLRTIATHDAVVLPAGVPEDYGFTRIGSSLRICNARRQSSVLLVRHYCRGGAGDPGVDNEIEEITFPKVRETWLADDLFDAVMADGRFPDVDRVAHFYQLGSQAAAARRDWRFKRFSDVLPDYRQPSPDCPSDQSDTKSASSTGTS